MKFFDKLFGIETNSGIKVGDWVNSYSKGIYRIEKIIDQYYDESSPELGENKIGDKKQNRIIVTKRFLNSKFKKSISYESCDEGFIRNLDTIQYAELKKVMTEQPEYIIELNKYEIPVITTIYNYKLQIPDDDALAKVYELVSFIKMGKTFQEIESEMKRIEILKLKPKNFGNYILQLFNFNYEYVKKKQIWRDARLIKG